MHSGQHVNAVCKISNYVCTSNCLQKYVLLLFFFFKKNIVKVNGSVYFPREKCISVRIVRKNNTLKIKYN